MCYLCMFLAFLIFRIPIVYLFVILFANTYILAFLHNVDHHRWYTQIITASCFSLEVILYGVIVTRMVISA